jgi:nucleoid-associated protein YgaU
LPKRRKPKEAEARRLAEEAEAKRLAEKAEADRKAALEAERKRLTDGRQAPSDAKGSEPSSLPVARDPDSSRPGNDGLPAAGQEKLAATPGSPKETTTKVRVRGTSLRAQRVGKRRYRRRATRARTGSRVYGSKTRRKCRRASRYRKRCWSIGAKQFSKRKIHRKRTVVSRYRKRHRVKVRGRSGIYVVRRRDTLWGIAKRYYGKGSKYRKIYRANRRKIRNPNRIYPGQRLYISAHRR